MSRRDYADFLYSSKSVLTHSVISLGPGFHATILTGWQFPDVWVQLEMQSITQQYFYTTQGSSEQKCHYHSYKELSCLGQGFLAQLQHRSDRAVPILVPGPVCLYCSLHDTQKFGVLNFKIRAFVFKNLLLTYLHHWLIEKTLCIYVLCNIYIMN